MAAQYLQVLTDPESFFERGEEAASPVVPVVAALIVGALGAVAAWRSFQATSEVFMQAGQGGGGAGGLTAVFSGVAVVVALVTPFVVWLVYALLFHGITAVLDGEGSLTTTLVYAGWGLLPKVVGSLVGLATTWIVLDAVQPPAEVTPQTAQAYQQAIQNHPASLAGTAVGILLLLWSAYIWVAAVQHARDVDRPDAMIAVGVPVAIALVIRLGTNFL